MGERLIANIDRFHGEYRFLSNFWYATTVYDGVVYRTSEHAFQAAKFLNPAHRRMVQSQATPAMAKNFARHNLARQRREDWDAVKIGVMRDCLRSKFLGNLDLGKRLAATGGAELIEGNTWGDTFWGVCNGQGENHLGKLLMDIRGALLLRQMASIYPGDPDGVMESEACKLLGIEYKPLGAIITYE